jgi:hypothetical protein
MKIKFYLYLSYRYDTVRIVLALIAYEGEKR